jgi:SAM-dependent methyltransferase
VQASAKWPKVRPNLTEEQQRIHTDFYRVWLEMLPKRFNAVEVFNHNYPIKIARKHHSGLTRTLDIGAGLGAHIQYEDLNQQEYVAVELQPHLGALLQEKYPEVKVLIGDCERGIEYPDGYFDRIMVIHVLEHLANLPAALTEIKRLLAPCGLFQVLIPCEGGFAYSMARNISARRIFEKRYNINHPNEIMDELREKFSIIHRSFFPLLVPNVELNLVIGLTLTSKDSKHPYKATISGK